MRDQLLDQFALDVNAVIDPGQRTDWLPNGISRPTHAVTSLGQFLGDLIRMVDVNVHHSGWNLQSISHNSCVMRMG